MKRSVLSLFIPLWFGLTLQAQPCIPVWPDTGYGILPDTIMNLPWATVNQPYETVVQFKVPPTILYNGVEVNIVKVHLTGVQGLADIPSSSAFSFACNPADCIFAADSVGCVVITGTPTTAGNYPLTILANVYLTPVLYVPFPTPGYRIIVQEDVGLPLMPDVTALVLSPNPATSVLAVHCPEALTQNVVRITDLYGREVFKTSTTATGALQQLDVTGLRAGVYHVLLNTSSGRRAARFIKM